MKITKAQIKKIIQEELQNVLDEEKMDENAAVIAATLAALKHAREKKAAAGGSVSESEEQDKVLNEDLNFLLQQIQDPAAWELMARALAKIITNFAPAAFGATAVMAVRRALGKDKDYEDEEGQQTA